MTRLLGIVAVAAVIAAAILTPTPAPGEATRDAVVPEPTAISVCPVVIDRTTSGWITASARVPGLASVSGFAGGRLLSEVDLAIDGTGGAVLGFEGVAVSGLAGALVEQPELDMAVGVSLAGMGVAAGNCTSPTSATTMAVGASTRGGERLDLLLVNPYAGDAVVSVSSSSEAGVDSASEFETVVVPARSIVRRDLGAVLPLRNRLSVSITANRGRIHGFLLQEGGADRALVEAVTPGASWALPLGPAPEAATETLVVASSSSVDLDVRLDGLLDGVWVEGLWEVTIPARSQAELDLVELDPRPAAIRVGADGLIAAGISIEDDARRSAAPLVPFASTDWFIAGGAGGETRVLVAVPGDLDVLVTIFPHATGVPAVEATVPAGASTMIPLPSAAGGYAIRSTGDVYVMWQTATEDGLATGAGVPIAEVGE